MEFEKLLDLAKKGNKGAQKELFLMYRALLWKRACSSGKFDEDLFQELSLGFLKCIQKF